MEQRVLGEEQERLGTSVRTVHLGLGEQHEGTVPALEAELHAVLYSETSDSLAAV